MGRWRLRNSVSCHLKADGAIQSESDGLSAREAYGISPSVSPKAQESGADV